MGRVVWQCGGASDSCSDRAKGLADPASASDSDHPPDFCLRSFWEPVDQCAHSHARFACAVLNVCAGVAVLPCACVCVCMWYSSGSSAVLRSTHFAESPDHHLPNGLQTETLAVKWVKGDGFGIFFFEKWELWRYVLSTPGRGKGGGRALLHDLVFFFWR